MSPDEYTRKICLPIFHVGFLWTLKCRLWAIASVCLMRFLCRHRSADHHWRHGDPHLTAHPWDAGGFLPVPGVCLQHPCGGGSRAYRRAGRVSPLQHHPQPGARPQSLSLFRQTDGELMGLFIGQIAYHHHRRLISVRVRWQLVRCCCWGHDICSLIDLSVQQIKIQESPEDMPAGQTPHTTIVYAHNDLVDKVQPGDRINITGKTSYISTGGMQPMSLSCHISLINQPVLFSSVKHAKCHIWVESWRYLELIRIFLNFFAN